MVMPIVWHDDDLFNNINIDIDIPKQSSNIKKIEDISEKDRVHTLKIDSQEVYIYSLSSDNSTLILEPKYYNTVLFLDSWKNVGSKVEIKGENKLQLW